MSIKGEQRKIIILGKFMHRIGINISILLCCLILCSGIFSPTRLEAENTKVVFKGDKISASYHGVTLSQVLEEVKKEKGIWYKGKTSFLNEPVSVQFRDLSLRDALKRILKNMNYSLVFEKEKLAGIIIIDKVKSGESIKALAQYPSVSRKNDSQKRIITSLAVTVRNLNNKLRVIKNSPTPGGLSELRPEDNENLRIIRNSPPPGGLSELKP